VVVELSKVERRFLKEKEARKLLSEFLEKVSGGEGLKAYLESPVEVAVVDDAEIFFVDGEPVLAKSRELFFPTLMSTKLLSYMPRVTVNMGAVPYVCNGADVMAPGIVRFEDDFRRDGFVVVSDERHQKPIAVGVALYDSAEARKLERGKVLRNVHYVGDRLWNLVKQLGQKK
jgi:PUA domain protein